MNIKTHLKVKEYAELMNISTSSVYRQIKEKKLKVETLNNTKYIVLDAAEEEQKNHQIVQIEAKKSSIEAEVILNNKKELQELEDIRDREIKFLRKQIIRLEKENQELLEACTENSKSLNRENNKLRSDLTSITNRLLVIFENPDKLLQDIEFVDQIKNDKFQSKNGLIELENYLIMNGFEFTKRIKIVEKFNLLKNSDERIILKNNKIHIHLTKYDYSDIFEV